MPSSVFVGGSRTSRTTTSGASARTTAPSSTALGSCATTVRPASSSSRASPARNSAESSTRTTRPGLTARGGPGRAGAGVVVSSGCDVVTPPPW
jgi:hypothetical protein